MLREKKYDVVLVGAGLGGLSTAAILSKYGYSVCVLEKHFQVGGAIQNFSRKGVVFDTGAHYVGGLDAGQNLHVLLKYLGVRDKLNLKKLDTEAYDAFSFLNSGKTFHHAQGFERFKERLLVDFPNEKQSLNAYVQMLNNIVDDFPLFRFSKEKSSIFESQYQHVPLSRGIDGLTSNDMLRNVLTGNNLLYAGEPERTPLSVHGLIHYSYIESAYRFVDGASQLAEELVRVIKKNGGEVIVKAEVNKFNFTKGHVSSVTLSNNEKVEGKHFISNMHPSLTFRMIDERHVRKIFRKRMLQLDNTCSIFTLYGVFKDQSFPYLNTNHYLCRDEHVWPLQNYQSQTWPQTVLFLTQPMANQGAYAKGFTVMAYMMYDEVKHWQGTSIENRGAQYQELKAAKTEQVLDMVEMKFPGFKASVAHTYTSTPLTYEDYTGTEQGSLYGVLRDANDGLKNLVLPKTKIPNLYFVGQNTVLHGVLGVLVGSLLVSSNFITFEQLIDDVVANAQNE